MKTEELVNVDIKYGFSDVCNNKTTHSSQLSTDKPKACCIRVHCA